MTLAIDRFRHRPLARRQEAEAQDDAQYLRNNPSLLLGYLESSVAIELERPFWRRSRLARDLRAVQIARYGR